MKPEEYMDEKREREHKAFQFEMGKIDPIFLDCFFTPQKENEEEIWGKCPFCLKDEHFYINKETNKWDCKHCPKSGNLKKFKGLIPEIEKRHGLEKDFLLPLYTDITFDLFSDSLGNDFPNIKFPERKLLISPFLAEKTITEISGEKGCGKTFLAMLLLIALTHKNKSGSKLKIGKFEVKKNCRAVYIDGEMPIDLLQERFIKMTNGLKRVKNYRIISFDDLSSRKEWTSLPYLTHEGWREEIYKLFEHRQEYKVLILDNISCLCPSMNENNKEEWDTINQYLLRLKRLGVSIIMLHHAGKDSGRGSRGTSAREDNIDTHIMLKGKSELLEGAHFEIAYDKARSFYGKEKAKWELKFTDKGNRIIWEEVKAKKAKRDNFSAFILLLVDGMIQKDIAKHLNKSIMYPINWTEK